MKNFILILALLVSTNAFSQVAGSKSAPKVMPPYGADMIGERGEHGSCTGVSNPTSKLTCKKDCEYHAYIGNCTHNGTQYYGCMIETCTCNNVVTKCSISPGIL